MLAQALAEYGLIDSLAQGVVRLNVWLHGWLNDLGAPALVVGGAVLAGWVVLRLLGR